MWARHYIKQVAHIDVVFLASESEMFPTGWVPAVLES
jgi:hypothetical protein